MSSIRIEALRPPAAPGVKLAVIVQFAFGTSDAPQLFVCEKSPLLKPTSVMPAIANVAPPVFVSVAVCGALVVPVERLPKLRLVGLRLTHGTEVPVGLFISV